MSGSGIYGGVDPADMPAYTLAEAAGLVGVPRSTLQKWTRGRSFSRKNGGTGTTSPIIKTSSANFLSFTNIVEAHVLAGLRGDRIGLDKIRSAVSCVERKFGVRHPLAREEFKTDGVNLFVERLGKLLNASHDGQVAMREVLDRHLRRVEFDEGRAVRLYPLFRPEAPRAIVIDHRRAFGRPTLVNTSIPLVDILARFDCGDSLEELAADYQISSQAVQEALRARKAA